MKVEGVVDRMEEDYAVIFLGENEKKVSWPKTLLPKGTKEGQILVFNLTIDQEKTKKCEQEIDELWKKTFEQ